MGKPPSATTMPFLFKYFTSSEPAKTSEEFSPVVTVTVVSVSSVGSGGVISGSVVVTSGSVVVTSGSVEVTSGSVEVTSGSVEVTSGSVEVTSGSVERVSSGVVVGVVVAVVVASSFLLKLQPVTKQSEKIAAKSIKTNSFFIIFLLFSTPRICFGMEIHSFILYHTKKCKKMQ